MFGWKFDILGQF